MNPTHRHPNLHHGLLTFLAALMLLPGCKKAEKVETRKAPAVARQNKELIGKPLADALAYYGPQMVQDRTYTASQLPEGVFYLPIRRRFPLTDPDAQTTLIREVHWRRAEDRVAVFCERKRGVWVIFDNTEWRESGTF